MTEQLPLPAQLSHALVAFTIEFDNEFEHRMPHRTTSHGSTPGMDRPPFLVSMAMWVNCMRFGISHRSGPAWSPTPRDGAPPSRNRGRCRTTR